MGLVRIATAAGAAAAALIASTLALLAAGERTGARVLSCRFEAGHTWTYENGKFASAAPQALSFDISDIDLEGQAAKLVMDGKPAGTLRIVRALNANSYLEVAQEGFLNLTTVYDDDPQTGNSPAVHSRHLGLLGQPIFAQYAGICSKK